MAVNLKPDDIYPPGGRPPAYTATRPAVARSWLSAPWVHRLCVLALVVVLSAVAGVVVIMATQLDGVLAVIIPAAAVVTVLGVAAAIVVGEVRTWREVRTAVATLAGAVAIGVPSMVTGSQAGMSAALVVLAVLIVRTVTQALE